MYDILVLSYFFWSKPSFRLIGPDYHADEKTVSICAKDNYSPYDRELTTRIINQAKKTNLNYCVDVFFHYGTDANAAIRAGNNVYAAAFGMAVIIHMVKNVVILIKS